MPPMAQPGLPLPPGWALPLPRISRAMSRSKSMQPAGACAIPSLAIPRGIRSLFLGATLLLCARYCPAAKTFRDVATFDDPTRYAPGVNYLFVGGVAMIAAGKLTVKPGSRVKLPGRALRLQADGPAD